MSYRRTMADLPRNEPGLVDNFLGTAYDVVKAVYDNLPVFDKLYALLGEIEDLASAVLEEAMIPIRIELAQFVQDAQAGATAAQAAAIEAAASAALALLSAQEAAASADRANAINVTYPFTFVEGQATYDVTVISGNPELNTTSLAIWVEGALEFDSYVINDLKTFTFTTPSDFANGTQMRIIINGKFDQVTGSLNDLAAIFEGEFDAAQAAREQEFQDYLAQSLLVENKLAEADGADMVNTQQVGDGAIVRSLRDKSREYPTPADYAASGTGVLLEDEHFAALEAVYQGRDIDLLGKTYLVTNFPIGNRYFNGKFKRQSDGLIMSSAYEGTLRSTNANVFIGRSVAKNLKDLGYADPLGTGRGYGLVAVGPNAMEMADDNTYNCAAYGVRALYNNKYGRYNDAFGGDTLYSTLGILGDGNAGSRNAAFGTNSMRFNTQGRLNAAFGRNVNQCGVTGESNSYFGVNAAGGYAPLDLAGEIINPYPRTASFMTGMGQSSLFWADVNYTTGFGYNAGYNIKKGSENTAIGARALEALERDVSPDGMQLISAPLSGTWSQAGTALTFNMTAHGMSVGFKVMVTLNTGAPQVGTDNQLFTITAVTADTWTAVAPDSATRAGTCNRVTYSNLTPATLSTGNTATGYNAMVLAPIGNNNTATGAHVLRVNTGNNNTMTGALAANVLASGGQNTGEGYSVMRALTSGNRNTGHGEFALGALVTGDDNTAIGRNALRNMQDGTPATAITGSTGIGIDARVSGPNQVQIGGPGTTPYAQAAVQIRSDERDKIDFRALSKPMELIRGIEWFEFRKNERGWYFDEVYDDKGESSLVPVPNDGSRAGERFHAGVKAQQVQQLCEALGIDWAGLQHHAISGGLDIYTVAYEALIPYMGYCIQQLLNKQDSFEERLAALEAK